MPKYLDTSGNSTLGIGICARCSLKFPLGELHPDPNAPGLLCCTDDLDVLDPYRLAPKKPDPITLMYARPDVKLYPGPVQYPVDRMQAALSVNSEERTTAQAISDGAAGLDAEEAIEGDPLAALYAGQTDPQTIDGATSILGVEVGTDDGIAVAAEVTQANVSTPWKANRYYPINTQVTPVNPVGEEAAGLEIYVFACVVPGLSGATAPTWTTYPGTVVSDGTVTWINMGLYLP